MRWSQITEVGLVRPDNEDNLLICADIGLFVVADGMGGHQAGEVASREALLCLEEQVRKMLPEAGDRGQMMIQAMHRANKHVYDLASKNAGLHGMGTTVTACLLGDKEVLVAHVGDSRAYLLRDNKITQVTDDHSLVGELVKNGSITEELAQIHPKRNILTQAVGVLPSIDVDLYRIPLHKDDKLLLCTDGLTNHLKGSEINEIVNNSRDLNDAVKKLANAALEQGGTDNVSIILIEI
ncbi:protein phosphatase [Desulfohalotomaculum tongense]|uniref:Stp1/IreP family PP2C-type Ser/Thr phosphatase n=1 Tax=Desulforadius tongensis TaxID=1216062 RepID=UPI00195D4188|nr:Stp1/IreP family PP2C-type Ser/Thr phosphatase [Desulforadius tongensis]MBM7855746.1 protein phosphatase [Desulforadius tongensis]